MLCELHEEEQSSGPVFLLDLEARSIAKKLFVYQNRLYNIEVTSILVKIHKLNSYPFS